MGSIFFIFELQVDADPYSANEKSIPEVNTIIEKTSIT